MADTVTTPWGKAQVVDELEIEQSADGRSFSSVEQLLQAADGKRLVRFAYRTEGTTRRGPVTLRAADLERLRDGLRERRELARTLGLRPR